MAECHRRLNQYARAAAAYQNAIRYEYPDSTVFLLLAQMQQATGNYRPPCATMREYLSLHPGDAMAQAGLSGSRTRTAEGRNHTICGENAKLFNSRRSDYSPMFFPEANSTSCTSPPLPKKQPAKRKSEITE